MKKKVCVGVAIAIVAVALIALIIFVFSGKSAETSLELNGVWKVAKNVTDGSISIPQNEYMIFSNGEASDFRDGNAAPFAKSSYRISGDVLELPDISRTYHIAQKTEQYISLYTADDTYISLVLADYRDNSENPSIEAAYEWNDNVIKAPDLGVEMVCSKVAANRIILVDINEGYIWLLTKAED